MTTLARLEKRSQGEVLNDLTVTGGYRARRRKASVRWSGNRPEPSHQPNVVRFRRDAAPVLIAAARELKTRAPREDYVLEGYVVALGNENVREQGGTITVAADVDGDTRRVRLLLAKEDYPKVIDAHSRMARVTSAGRLIKSGRQYELQAARDFGLLGDE